MMISRTSKINCWRWFLRGLPIFKRLFFRGLPIFKRWFSKKHLTFESRFNVTLFWWSFTLYSESFLKHFQRTEQPSDSDFRGTIFHFYVLKCSLLWSFKEEFPTLKHRFFKHILSNSKFFIWFFQRLSFPQL